MAIKCLFTAFRLHRIMDYSTACHLCPCRHCREHVAFLRRRKRLEKVCGDGNEFLAHMLAVEGLSDSAAIEFMKERPDGD